MRIHRALKASPCAAAYCGADPDHEDYFFISLGALTYCVMDGHKIEPIEYGIWNDTDFMPLETIPSWAFDRKDFVGLWNKYRSLKSTDGPDIALQPHMIGAGCCSHCCKYDGPIFLVRLGWSSQTTTVRFCRDCLIDTVDKIASDIGFQKISRQTRAAKKPKKVTKRKRVKR